MDESFIIANRTDVGRVRQVNEDSMVTFDSPNGRVLAVCDGMGGQAAGDVASRLACDIITDILTNNRFDSPTEAITRACMAANQAIVHRATQNPDLEGMGSTCVMVIIKDGLVYYGWIGDSRIYYISRQGIQQLSHDQSYVQQLVDEGSITSIEAAHHPQKNEILNALGLPNMTPPALCVAPFRPEPGSVILLCSDGLSGLVDDHTIASIVNNPDMTLQGKASKLVSVACANGGTDNVTVQLVQFGKKPIPATAAKNNKLSFGLIGVIALAIVAVIFGIFFLFSGDKGDDSGSGKTRVNPTVQHKSTPASKSTTSQKSSAPKSSSQSSTTPKTTKQSQSQSQSKSKTPDLSKVGKKNDKKENKNNFVDDLTKKKNDEKPPKKPQAPGGFGGEGSKDHLKDK